METETKNETNESEEEPLEDKTDSVKKTLSNIVVVIFSNLLTALSGILVGFIIPKIMGVTDYGYYKTFTLYVSYIGLLHFGFVDGIYLLYAGKKYEDLDKQKFKTFSHHLFFVTLIITLIFVAVGAILNGLNIGIILMFVGLDTMASLMTSYYEFITQVTMQFKKLSFRSILNAILRILSVVILYLLYKFANVAIYFWVYIICYLAIKYILMFWYVFSYKEITFGRGSKFKEVKGEILNFYKMGFPLLLANLVGQFLFVVDQQTVNVFFDIDTYSNYAFAYSMISLITVATSAISTVLYPTIKTMNESKIKGEYSKLNAILLVFVSFCLLCYFVLVPFVTRFLPDYVPSLTTLKIILPGILISSSISVIKYNCYKRFNKIGNYFIKSVIVLGIAIGADVAVYYIFKTTNSISIVSIFVLLLWYILVEAYFIKTYHIEWIRNLIYMILSIAAFYGCTFIPNIWVGLLIYLVSFIALTFAVYNKKLIEFINKSLKKKKIKDID